MVFLVTLMVIGFTPILAFPLKKGEGVSLLEPSVDMFCLSLSTMQLPPLAKGDLGGFALRIYAEYGYECVAG